jgi:preprotein translocase subunit SecA
LRYKEESFRLFQMMNGLLRLDVARVFLRLQIQAQQPEPAGAAAALAEGGFAPKAALTAEGAGNASAAPRPGANDPCPCGSGQAFRRCHGA